MSLNNMVMQGVLVCISWALSAGLAVGKWFGLDGSVDYLYALLHVGVRGGAGGFAAAGLERAPVPAQPLIIYEYSGCPFCKRVRETISALALDVIVFPTPRVTLKAYGELGDSRYRGLVKDLGGKVMFPCLQDPNTDTVMYESGDIVEYLWSTYGPRGGVPRPWFAAATAGAANTAGLFLATLFRALPHMGVLRTPSSLPSRRLEYWGHEGSPSCRQVHEVLCTLELPYLYHNTPAGAGAQLAKLPPAGDGRPGSVPTLVDPNAGVTLHGAEAIAQHLRERYQTGPVCAETLADYSTKGASSAHGTLYGKSKAE